MKSRTPHHDDRLYSLQERAFEKCGFLRRPVDRPEELSFFSFPIGQEWAFSREKPLSRKMGLFRGKSMFLNRIPDPG